MVLCGTFSAMLSRTFGHVGSCYVRHQVRFRYDNVQYSKIDSPRAVSWSASAWQSELGADGAGGR